MDLLEVYTIKAAREAVLSFGIQGKSWYPTLCSTNLALYYSDFQIFLMSQSPEEAGMGDEIIICYLPVQRKVNTLSWLPISAVCAGNHWLHYRF